MAIDTAQKRASAFSFNAVWRLPAVSPDGAFSQADRQHTLWNYTGILVGAAPEAAPEVVTPVAIKVGGYGPATHVHFAWARFILPQWTTAATARPIPQRSQATIVLPALARGLAHSRAIHMSHPAVTSYGLALAVTSRGEMKAMAKGMMPGYSSTATCGLFMSMEHVRRLLEDEREVEVLIGKL